MRKLAQVIATVMGLSTLGSFGAAGRAYADNSKSAKESGPRVPDSLVFKIGTYKPRTVTAKQLREAGIDVRYTRNHSSHNPGVVFSASRKGLNREKLLDLPFTTLDQIAEVKSDGDRYLLRTFVSRPTTSADIKKADEDEAQGHLTVASKAFDPNALRQVYEKKNVIRLEAYSKF